jgi:hypothetical protein
MDRLSRRTVRRGADHKVREVVDARGGSSWATSSRRDASFLKAQNPNAGIRISKYPSDGKSERRPHSPARRGRTRRGRTRSEVKLRLECDEMRRNSIAPEFLGPCRVAHARTGVSPSRLQFSRRTSKSSASAASKCVSPLAHVNDTPLPTE